MPSSSDFGKLYSALMLKKMHEAMPFRDIFDVGVGEGTYHKWLAGELPGASWTGIEVWPPYFDEFDLSNRYSRMVLGDIRTFDHRTLPELDLTIFGDVLEHMAKADAQTIVNQYLALCGVLLISIPVVPAPQGEVYGNPYEVHVKDDWSHDEVLASFPAIHAGLVHQNIGVYFLSAHAVRQGQLRQLHAVIPGILRRKLPENAIRWPQT